MSRRSPLEILDDSEGEDITCTDTSTKVLPPASQPTVQRQASRSTAAQRSRHAAAAAAAAAAVGDEGVLPMDQSDGPAGSEAFSDGLSSSPAAASSTPAAAASSSAPPTTDARHLLKQAAADRAARLNKTLPAAAAASTSLVASASAQAGPPPKPATAAALSSRLPMPDAMDEDDVQSMGDGEVFVYDEAPLDTTGDEELARLLQQEETAAASRISTPSPRRNSVSPQRRLSEFRTIDPDYVSSGRCLAIPPTTGDEVGFFFNRVHGQQNRCAMRLSTIISGDVQRAVLFNYCIDMDWMFEACPQLQTYPRVDVVTVREKGAAAPPQKDPFYLNTTYYTPPMPLSYGTHHSKMVILFYTNGIRVCIVTANFIAIDWVWKNNLLFSQDFPRKNANSPSTSIFENDLCDYMLAYKRSQLDIIGDLQQYDFSAAKCILIPSVPGWHKGAMMQRYGHMKMRHVLSREQFPAKFAKAPIVAQFSSVGSITESWLHSELRASLGAQQRSEPQPAAASAMSALMQSSTAAAQLPPLKLIWPTVPQVQHSLEGWSAGGSLCCDDKNMKDFMKRIMHVWDGLPQDRDRAMPHIKSYTRAAPDGELAWVLMTSANLSNAAWGQLQKQGTQLQIRSYELGCLFLPSHYARALQILKSRRQVNFSCTPDQPLIYSPHGDRSKLPYFSSDQDARAPPTVRLVALPPTPIYAATHPTPAAGAAAPSSATKRKAAESIEIDGEAAGKRTKYDGPSAAAASSSSVNESTIACTPAASSSSSSDSSSSSSRLPYTVICPLPYNLFSRAYTEKDTPWTWTPDRNTPDCRGNGFQGIGQHRD